MIYSYSDTEIMQHLKTNPDLSSKQIRNFRKHKVDAQNVVQQFSMTKIK